MVEPSKQITVQKTWYNQSIESILEEFKVNKENGLTQTQVATAHEQYGTNELKKVERSFYNVIIAPIINLLIIIYLASAFAMWALGDIKRALPTLLIVGFNAGVAIIQQFRAEKQLQALKKLSEATTLVKRESEYVEIPNSEVVCGDIVKLTTGDKIPADCRILSERNLAVDESSLTGESEPVKKITKILSDGADIPLQDQQNMLFMGTFVASGSGEAVVVRIGEATEIGQISRKLEESTTGDIPLRNKMNHIAKYLGIGVLILLVLSIIWKSIFIFQDRPFVWGGDDGFKQALVDSIDLGMKVMPINLPLLTTIVLLTGVLAMAQKGVIIREVSRTESLGRVSIVCTDKTGTLTKNEMTVVKIWTPENEYVVEGTGYSPEGTIHYPWNPVMESHSSTLTLLILSGYLNNNSVLQQEAVKIIGRKDTETKWTITGHPTEAALKVLAQKYGDHLLDQAKEYEFVHEFSFSSQLKRMSQVYQKNGNQILFAKGATERILALSNRVYQEEKIISLDDAQRGEIETAMQAYAAQGYRILSVAYKSLEDPVPKSDFEQAHARDSYESELVYLGFVVIQDPPRDDVKQAIQESQSAGITPIMITGDNKVTAVAIAQNLGIYNPDIHKAIEGNQIESLSDEEFQKVTVYARVSPDHKQQIVRRYQEMDKLVAMSGDGVNDALALSLADCGLAMGIQGTEVAKEAADMIITDDAFSTIVTGIREGRGLFEKIRTILYFFVCISVMEAIILFTSTLNVNNPFFAMWDYWQLNLLYVTAHMFPSLGFTFGTYSKSIMEEPPRDSAEILTKNLLKIMAIQMVLMGLAIILSYYLSFLEVIPLNEVNNTVGYRLPGEEAVPLRQIKARTMAFVVLFILESFIMPMQIRRMNDPIQKSFQDITYWREFSFYLPSLLILIFAIYSLPFQEFMAKNLTWQLNFMYLSWTDWLVCIAFCIPGLVGFELIRRVFWNKGVRF